MALTTAELAALTSHIVEALEPKFVGLSNQIENLNQRTGRLERSVDGLERSVDDLADRTARLERGVNAIETAPVPYGKPKTFVSATDWHSVSNPKRVKQGYQG